MAEWPATSADGTASGKARRPPWALAWLALLGWQFWLALGLLGPEPFARLTDDSPIVSGAHPQHLYLGARGAQAFIEHGHTTAFHPGHDAAFLKTPIFDGSRLAEVFLILGGGSYRPEAYKIGILGVCLLVPLLILFAFRSAGLDRLT